MRREEKNLQSRLRIIEGALAEFGEKSYSEASLNSICSASGISKGIIYHYFKDKDELYLVCVQKCFDALLEILSSIELPVNQDLKSTLKCYFEARLSFFSTNPLLFKIYCDAVAAQPQHLKQAINDIKRRFDTFNIEKLTQLLRHVKLRENISLEGAVLNFSYFQEYFNFRYQREFGDRLSDRKLPKHHEESCEQFLDILLYGMIEREE